MGICHIERVYPTDCLQFGFIFAGVVFDILTLRRATAPVKKNGRSFHLPPALALVFFLLSICRDRISFVVPLVVRYHFFISLSFVPIALFHLHQRFVQGCTFACMWAAYRTSPFSGSLSSGCLIQPGKMLDFYQLSTFFRGYGSYRNRLMLKDMINANDIRYV